MMAGVISNLCREDCPAGEGSGVRGRTSLGLHRQKMPRIGTFSAPPWSSPQAGQPSARPATFVTERAPRIKRRTLSGFPA
jgi:hypothetical protein